MTEYAFGDWVRVRQPNGETASAGALFGAEGAAEVWVCDDHEWRISEREGRDPEGTAVAAADVIKADADPESMGAFYERAGDLATDTDAKRLAYERAHERYGLFASWATAGGEGLARMIDVNRLEEKLRALASGPPPQETPG